MIGPLRLAGALFVVLAAAVTQVHAQHGHAQSGHGHRAPTAGDVMSRSVVGAMGSMATSSGIWANFFNPAKPVKPEDIIAAGIAGMIRSDASPGLKPQGATGVAASAFLAGALTTTLQLAAGSNPPGAVINGFIYAGRALVNPIVDQIPNTGPGGLAGRSIVSGFGYGSLAAIGYGLGGLCGVSASMGLLPTVGLGVAAGVISVFGSAFVNLVVNSPSAPADLTPFVPPPGTPDMLRPGQASNPLPSDPGGQRADPLTLLFGQTDQPSDPGPTNVRRLDRLPRGDGTVMLPRGWQDGPPPGTVGFPDGWQLGDPTTTLPPDPSAPLRDGQPTYGDGLIGPPLPPRQPRAPAQIGSTPGAPGCCGQGSNTPAGATSLPATAGLPPGGAAPPREPLPFPRPPTIQGATQSNTPSAQPPGSTAPARVVLPVPPQVPVIGPPTTPARTPPPPTLGTSAYTPLVGDQRGVTMCRTGANKFEPCANQPVGKPAAATTSPAQTALTSPTHQPTAVPSPQTAIPSAVPRAPTPGVTATPPKPSLPPALVSAPPKPSLPPALGSAPPRPSLPPALVSAPPKPSLPPALGSVPPRPSLPPTLGAPSPAVMQPIRPAAPPIASPVAAIPQRPADIPQAAINRVQQNQQEQPARPQPPPHIAARPPQPAVQPHAVRPPPQPAARPQQQAVRPPPQPAARPQQQAVRPSPQPVARPQPQVVRPSPQPAARPQPQVVQRSQPVAPVIAPRPAPVMAPRPAPPPVRCQVVGGRQVCR